MSEVRRLMGIFQIYNELFQNFDVCENKCKILHQPTNFNSYLWMRVSGRLLQQKQVYSELLQLLSKPDRRKREVTQQDFRWGLTL